MDSLLNTYLTLLKMSETDPRYESMLFNYETTAKQDFRKGAILNIQRTTYKEKPKCLRVRPPSIKDMQTLTHLKNPYIPIDLLVQPKEVVRSNPHRVQKPYAPLEDLDRELVRATRPRVVMTPAVSMDDIKNERQRQILTKEMYTSSAKLAMEQGIASDRNRSSNVKAPLQGTLSPPNPITIKTQQFPDVAPEWRMASVPWDRRQLRSYCDPSREFYLGRPLRCEVCAETSARETDRRMLKRIKRTN